MYALGISAAVVDILQKMNPDYLAYIDTPYGLSKKISIESTLRQGTILGPGMCVIETDRINNINQRIYAIRT